MMVHVLSGQWPFPGEAVRVNPRKPNDVVGVTEFDRREEYINLIGNEHPLMTLIQGCLSNSPSHRPTSSEVHQRVSVVAADHPPSFTNRVEIIDRIKALGRENERVQAEKDTAVAEKNREMMDRIQSLNEEKERVISAKDHTIAKKDATIMERENNIAELKETQSLTIERLCQSHSIRVEALQSVIDDIEADNEHLKVTISAKEKAYTLEQESTEKEKHAIEERHRSEINIIKANHQQEIEALKRSYQLDRQALEERQVFQLRALVEEHHTIKEAMKQQHQAQLESKVNELSAKDTLIISKSSTIQNLRVKLGQALGTASGNDIPTIFTPGMKLSFTECVKMPISTGGLDQGIVVGKDVYFGVGADRNIFKYSIIEDAWSMLPQSPIQYARIGYLYKKLLLVGGVLLSSRHVTADIHEFNNTSQQWVKSTSIPPMPTARRAVTVVSWSSPPALIVCGGSNQQDQPMAIVEVYHSQSSQWHIISPLPFPRDYMTHTIVNNMLYLVAGRERADKSSYKKKVACTSILQLLAACLKASPVQWQSLQIPSVPNYKSTAASLGGSLLVVGGLKDLTYPPKPKSIVSSVHAYCPFTSSWVRVGQLPQPLYHCITTVLPTGELLVIGGVTSAGGYLEATNVAYKCTLSRAEVAIK